MTAFSVLVPLAEVDSGLAGRSGARGVPRRRPGPSAAAGGIALVHRRALGLRRGEKPSPELGAMVVDMKRRYLELRPALARVFVA